MKGRPTSKSVAGWGESSIICRNISASRTLDVATNFDYSRWLALQQMLPYLTHSDINEHAEAPESLHYEQKTWGAFKGTLSTSVPLCSWVIQLDYWR